MSALSSSAGESPGAASVPVEGTWTEKAKDQFVSIKGRKIWVPDQEYMKTVAEKAEPIFKAVAGFTATALMWNLSAAVEELPFGHTAALIVGQLLQHAVDVGANNKHVREAAQQAQFMGHVISTLLEAEFPSNTPVFERTIDALCSLRDVASKWDRKSWKEKDFGISLSTFQTTAAKYNHLFKLQIAEVELCRKHLMDEVNADTYAAIEDLKTECAKRDEELLSTLQEAGAATRVGLKSQSESLEIIKGKVGEAHQAVVNIEAVLSDRLDAFEDQLQDALKGVSAKNVAQAVTVAVVAAHDELKSHFGSALEESQKDQADQTAAALGAVVQDAAANKEDLLEQMHSGMQALAAQMKEDGRASAEAASVATQQVTVEEILKVVDQVRESEAKIMDGIAEGIQSIEAQLSALVDSSSGGGEAASSADDLAAALEPMLEEQATKIMTQVQTNRKQDRKLILKKLHRAAVEAAKTNEALAGAKDEILAAVHALDAKITNRLDGIQQCLAAMAAHPNATPAEVKDMIDAAVAAQEQQFLSLGSAGQQERQALLLQLQDAATQHAAANAATSDEHKTAILDAIAVATGPAAIAAAQVASLEAKVEALQLKIDQLQTMTSTADQLSGFGAQISQIHAMTSSQIEAANKQQMQSMCGGNKQAQDAVVGALEAEEAALSHASGSAPDVACSLLIFGSQQPGKYRGEADDQGRPHGHGVFMDNAWSIPYRGKFVHGELDMIVQRCSGFGIRRSKRFHGDSSCDGEYGIRTIGKWSNGTVVTGLNFFQGRRLVLTNGSSVAVQQNGDY